MQKENKIFNEISDEFLSKITGGVTLSKEEEKKAFDSIGKFLTYRCIYYPDMIAWVRDKNSSDLSLKTQVGKYDKRINKYVSEGNLMDYRWTVSQFVTVFDISQSITGVTWEK